MTAHGGLASTLVNARDAREPVARFTSSRHLSMTDAYAIQRAVVDQLIDSGEIPVGLKLGFTSAAKAREMGVDRPIAGVLTDRMAVADGGTVRAGTLIHPRVEPELAFRLDLDDGEARLRVAPALEIIDSRFAKFDFAAADVIADNASCAHFVIGRWTEVDVQDRLDGLADAGVSLVRDTTVAAEGRTSAILGHPKHALGVARELAEIHDLATPREAILLAGAATRAIPFEAGHRYSARIEGLGEVSVVAG